MRLSIIIPVFNEVNTIEEILTRVRAVPLDKQIILVDDGSEDGTRALLDRQRGVPDTEVVFHARNQGKGAAIRTGLRHVRGDFVVVQDADLEYDPQEYLPLLEPLLNGSASVVFGSRFRGNPRKMNLLHWLGNKLLTVTTNLLYGCHLTDMETCYKVFRADIPTRIRIVSDRFDFEPEITAKVLRLGHRILELPISYNGRQFHEGKKITWRDGFAAIRALLAYRFVPLGQITLPDAEPIVPAEGEDPEDSHLASFADPSKEPR